MGCRYDLLLPKIGSITGSIGFWKDPKIQKSEENSTTSKNWIKKLEGKHTALKNWIQKMEGNSTTPENCVLTSFLNERSTIFYQVFSLVWFWILLRNDFSSYPISPQFKMWHVPPTLDWNSDVLRFLEVGWTIYYYRGSPDRTNFAPPGNHTIYKKLYKVRSDLVLK